MGSETVLLCLRIILKSLPVSLQLRSTLQKNYSFLTTPLNEQGRILPCSFRGVVAKGPPPMPESVLKSPIIMTLSTVSHFTTESICSLKLSVQPERVGK